MKKNTAQLHPALFLFLIFGMFVCAPQYFFPQAARADAYGQLEDAAGGSGVYVPPANGPVREDNGSDGNQGSGENNGGEKTNWATKQFEERDKKVDEYKQRRAERIKAADQRRKDAQAAATATAYQQWQSNVSAEQTKTAEKNNNWLKEEEKRKEEAAKAEKEAHFQQARKDMNLMKDKIRIMEESDRVITDQLDRLTKALARNAAEFGQWQKNVDDSMKNRKNQCFDLVTTLLIDCSSYKMDEITSAKLKALENEKFIRISQMMDAGIYNRQYKETRELMAINDEIAVKKRIKAELTGFGVEKTGSDYIEALRGKKLEDATTIDMLLATADVGVEIAALKCPELSLYKNLGKIDYDILKDVSSELKSWAAIHCLKNDDDKYAEMVKELSVELKRNMEQKHAMQAYIENYKEGVTPPYRAKNILYPPPPPLQ
jgi:hypothetical protein